MAARIVSLRSALACALILASVSFTSGCVRFQPAVLYSGVEQIPPPERPRSISLAVEPVIYADQHDDTIWFQDDTRCTQGRISTDVVYAGERAVEVSWDRGAEGCNWAGLGFGWDNWVGKDLSELLPYAAIEMHVRSKEGTMYGLPVVLTFEDYSGGMGFSYTDNKYFERTFIDEEWQKVVVPLSSFDIEIENLDLTNVKQLMLELQQSGSMYLDEIRLIFYEEEVQEPWLVEQARPDPLGLPIVLFDDAFINNNGWGLVTDDCQSIQLTRTYPSTGAAAIHAQWNILTERCFRAEMGVSWDRWYPVDVTSIRSSAAIQFDLRIPDGTATSLPFRIGLEDYGKRLSVVSVVGSYSPTGQFTTGWQTVTIPLSELEGEADFTSIKQLVFHMHEAGEMFIDNIRLIYAR